MAYGGEFDGTDSPGVPGTVSGGNYLTYDYLGQDPSGKNVYRGSDGAMYTDDPAGMNGFGPYSGPGVGAAAPGESEPTGPTTPVSPPPTGGAPAGGGTLGDYTLPGAPVFTPPGYTPPPAFAPPSADAILNDPGYQFRLESGEQALMNNRAARGVLNTGGTLKDFLNYNQNFASQEYGNVWDRAFNTYKTNYGTQFTDPYDIAYKGALDAFSPQFSEWQAKAADIAHRADEDRRYAWMLANG